VAILSDLATEEQAHAILNVVEQKWSDLIGYISFIMVISHSFLKNISS
jgi:hypothetical protein